MTARAASARSVPVVRFRVGELRAAVAADCVDAISAPPPGSGSVGGPGGAVHAAALMGDAPPPATAAQRRVRVRHRAEAIELVVDGPVVMASVTACDIVPVTNGLARAGFVLGFARLRGEVVALLDAAKLIAAHRAARAAPAADPSGQPARAVDRELRETS